MFEDEHRVWIANRGPQKSIRVGGRAGDGDLEAGDVQEPVLARLGMLGREAGTGAVASPDRHRKVTWPPVM